MERSVNVFWTWEAFYDKVENTEPAKASCNHAVNNEASKDWDLDAGYEGAIALSKTGYTHPLKAVERLATHVEDKVDISLFQTEFASVHDVSGSEVDLDAYLSGIPECLVESTPLRISKRGRAVRLVVPIVCSAGTTSKQFRERGAAVVALADLLARAQHPVEIWIANPIGVSGRYLTNDSDFVDLVRIQAADEPLDVGRLLFCIAHPACFRRLGFRSMEQASEELVKAFGPGYGNVAKVNPDDLPDQAENTFILEPLDYRQTWDEPHAAEWILGVLDEVFG